MRDVLITIIIPTRNSGQFLPNCLQSIFAQTLTNFEVIVVDGDSTDDTVAIASEYARRHPGISFISEKDKGIYDAMNKGVSLAKGAWLYFLGSDDSLYDENVLERVFSNPIHPSALLVYGRAFVMSSSFITPIDYNFGNLAKYNICHQAIFYSKEVFKNLRFSLDFGALSDWDLNLRIVGRNRNALFPVDVMICRYSGTGVSGKWKTLPEYKKHFSSVLKNYWTYLPFHIFIIKTADVLARRVKRNLFSHPLVRS